LTSSATAPLNIFYRSKLWSFIWAYIALIYLTLPLMRNILRWIKSSFGPESLSLGLNLLLACAALALLATALRHGLKTLLLIAVPLAAMGSLALQLPIAEERIHFLQYGLLGLLVVKTTRLRSTLQLLAAGLFVIAVGGGDELIQWWLPNRVGDWRDVGINTLAGLLGVAMGASLFWREAKQPQALKSDSTIS